MKLSSVIEGLKPILFLGGGGSKDIQIKGMCHDSRHFQPGDLFVAIRGEHFDGHLFIPEACNKGALAVVVEDERMVPISYDGAVIKIKNTRRALDTMASNFFEKPSEKIFIAGITGTNGKTTTSYMIESLLNAHDMPAAVIGTIDTHLGHKKYQASHTTPDALQTQRLLYDWIKEGARACVMEVSSHALALARVNSVNFDVAVFTNITRDHLDFHKSMDEYIKTKALLFNDLLKNSRKKNKRAIINIEDPHFEQIHNGATPVWTYGFEKGDFQAHNIELSFEGSRFSMQTPKGLVDVSLPMVGKHNILNALAAFGVGLHLGFSLTSMATTLKNLKGVRGRMERVASRSPINIFVDYAHSEDALKNVLSFLLEIREKLNSSTRIITVFGCGGDRDKGKRPLMMHVCQSHSDITIVTSDNPRTEDPEKIINEILDGANPVLLHGENPKIFRESDRKKAIKLAVRMAKPGDVILIAGKGHENYQIIGHKKQNFDDVEIAKEILGK
jgi:UDP-N-acetylmuramoyl-L-alanyl-D-glutamate--2,6-diaminopimelate ligase